MQILESCLRPRVPAMTARLEIRAEEYRARAKRVADLGAAEGLDGVLAWSRGGGSVDRFANVLYLTNYCNPWPAVPDALEMWSGQGNAGALVTADGDRVLITNVPEYEWRGTVHCEDFVDNPRIDLGLAAALRRHGLDGGRVGLAADGSLALGLYHRLTAAVPSVTWVPADRVLLEVRRIKSPTEMDVIRRAVSVGDAMMAAMLETVRPGATEAGIYLAGLKIGLELGLAPYDALMASGPRPDALAPSSLPAWSQRALSPGDLWRVDLYGTWHGYLFDFSRTTVAGEASSAQLEILEATTQIVEDIVAFMGPGVTFAEAFRAGEAATHQHASWQRRTAPHDYPHFGHTIGLGWEDHWIAPHEERTFEPGMHVAVETTVGRPDTGFAMFEQNLLVVDRGVELTSQCDRRPWRAAAR